MDKQLDDLRKIYLKQAIPGYLKDHGFADLKIKLEERNRPSVLPAFRRYSIAFVALLILMVIYLVNATEKSTPGSKFYSVKVLSEDVIGKIDKSLPLNLKLASPSANLSSPSSTPKIKPTQTPTPKPTPESATSHQRPENQSGNLNEPHTSNGSATGQVRGDSIQLPVQNNPSHGNDNSNTNSGSQKGSNGANSKNKD